MADENPTATLTEIENAVDDELSVARIELIEELALQARSRDLREIPLAERLKCPECGRPVVANGKQSRTLTTNHDKHIDLERSKAYCKYCEVSFSPLDEELGLVPGQFTPQVQAAMSRLGSKIPFEQEAEKIWDGRRIHLSEGTVRQTTYRHGKVAEALIEAEVERLEKEAPTATAKAGKLMVSADGAMVPLVNGEWREVKSVAVGEVAEEWVVKKGEILVQTKEISCFSRSYRAREFERGALAELHRRGIDNAETVIAVNDGAEWIQSFIDYHCPKAVRIIDFAHAQGYLAQAGKAIWGEETPLFEQWYKSASHRLKHKPPQQTVANLRLLQQKVKTDRQAADVDGAIFLYPETPRDDGLRSLPSSRIPYRLRLCRKWTQSSGAYSAERSGHALGSAACEPDA
jgi:hypothetical protein